MQQTKYVLLLAQFTGATKNDLKVITPERGRGMGGEGNGAAERGPLRRWGGRKDD